MGLDHLSGVNISIFYKKAHFPIKHVSDSKANKCSKKKKDYVDDTRCVTELSLERKW